MTQNKAAKAARAKAIFTAVFTCIPADEAGISWKEIMAVVNAVATVKNWMEVRNILQFLMDEGAIARLPRADVEKYRKI